jgi:hypothetical protein
MEYFDSIMQASNDGLPPSYDEATTKVTVSNMSVAENQIVVNQNKRFCAKVCVEAIACLFFIVFMIVCGLLIFTNGTLKFN